MTKPFLMIISMSFVLLGMDASRAQGALEQQKQLAAPPQIDWGPDSPRIYNELKNNDVDTSQQTYSYEPAQAPKLTKIDPYRAESGPLTLLNCGGKTLSVETYNSNDAVMWVPYAKTSIRNGSQGRLKCATSACKLKLGARKTGARSGYQVYVAGSLKATNQAAMKQGCNTY